VPVVAAGPEATMAVLVIRADIIVGAPSPRGLRWTSSSASELSSGAKATAASLGLRGGTGVVAGVVF
jgi:hypothetical protein